MVEQQPPVLSDNEPYEQWRRDIEGWMMVTNIEPRRQAFAVRMKMEGKYRKLALSFDAADLNNESGMMFLLEKLDFVFRRKKKDDKQKPRNEESDEKAATPDNNMSAVEKAKLRAQKLSEKLAAEGKYQTPPMSLLPNAVSNPVDQFKKTNPNIQLPEVKKFDNGGYFAEFDINDPPARTFLVKVSTQDLISSQSGASLSLKGRYLNAEEKKQSIVSGRNEKPLTLMIQADVAAKVLVAIHKIKDVITNYDKQGPNSHNNYGLTGNQQQNNYHFVQRKLFIGSEQFHSDFDTKKHLLGEEGANLNFIIRQTGAKVFLRGRGSGYLEQNSGKESFEALHVYVSHPEQAGLDSACQLCESLIDSVKARHHEFEQNQFLLKHNMPYQQPTPQHGGMRPQHGGMPPQHGRMQRPVYSQQQYQGNTNFRPNMYQMRPRQHGPDQHRMPYQQYRPQHQPPVPRVPMSMEMYVNSIENNHSYGEGSPSRYPNEIHENGRRFHDRNRERRRSRSRSPRHRRSDSRSPNRSFSPEHSQSHARSPRRGRSPHRRSRGRSRSFSQSRSRSPSNETFSEFQENSRSRSRGKEKGRRFKESPERKRDSPEKPRKRKFTEEPRKKRKFSEDPKLLEKARSMEDPMQDIPEEDRPAPKLQFRSVKKESKSKVDLVMPPPPMPPVLNAKAKNVSSLKRILPPKKEVKEKIDIFKAPEPITIMKAAPKALKIGALSTLNAYGDSDEED